ncbi:hypothetical protein FA15DRAFT_625163 [Coprinopsis marcescibilis]|uniref:Uncharacterized protein n=1 Tax=Coprinopsis marcescibilis TaxID=230819 RepID=A0A5C3KKW7_COPMA|nr:hypothetical protein FA15DRAFT_625163 [Coprinopsis marcescibilis]
MLSQILLSSLLLLAPTLSSAQDVATSTSGPSQCVIFDASWNLLAFNFDGKDYNVGAQLDSSTPAQDITTDNRPPFDVTSSPPLCFLSKFANAIYVLNSDANDRASVYIYDATAKSWSKQQTSNPPSTYDPSTFGAILDHDTNVFYVLNDGEMSSLNMDALKAASGESIPWNTVQRLQLSPEGVQGTYEPVLALAHNHIHFLGVPGIDAGNTKIFVIHFSHLQPEPQYYGEPQFPNSHGKTTSFFRDIGVQTQYAYIPDDGSNTYVVDVTTNSTRIIPGPARRDPYATYAASPNALVQLASTAGAISWIGYNQETGQGTSWQTLPSFPVSENTPSTGNGSGNSSSGAGSGSNSSNSGARTPANTTSTNSSSPNTSNQNAGAAGLGYSKQLLIASTMLVGFVLSVAGVVL